MCSSEFATKGADAVVKRNIMTRLVSDSDCRYCGGMVGSHSDLCLDCGADQVTWFEMWPAFLFLAVCIGVGVLVEMKGRQNALPEQPNAARACITAK